MDSDRDTLEDLERDVEGIVELTQILHGLTIKGMQETSEEGISPDAKTRHELRTPLNAIVGYTEIIFDSGDQQQNQKKLAHHTAIISTANTLMQEIDSIDAGTWML